MEEGKAAMSEHNDEPSERRYYRGNAGEADFVGSSKPSVSLADARSWVQRRSSIGVLVVFKLSGWMSVKKRKAAENERRGAGRQRDNDNENDTRASSMVNERPAHKLLPRLRVTQRDELSAELLELAAPVQQHLDLRRGRGRAVHNGLGTRLGTGLGTGLERRPLVCTRAADRPLVELRSGLSRTERPALGAGGSLGGDEGEHGECGGEAGGGVGVVWCGGRWERYVRKVPKRPKAG